MDNNQESLSLLDMAKEALVNHADLTALYDYLKTYYEETKADGDCKIITPWIKKKAAIGRDFIIWKLSSENDSYKIFKALGDKLKGRFLGTEEMKLKFNLSSSKWETTPHYNILFSGGYDSLSLAIRHLEKGEAICPFFISFDPQERILAEISVKILQHIYGTDKVGNLQKLFGPIHGDAGIIEYRFAQQPIAAFYASFISEHYLKSAIATEIAYCANDDALSYLEDLKNLYNASMEMKLHRIKVPLQFPQIKYFHSENGELVNEIESRRNVVFPVYEYDANERNITGFQTDTDYWILLDGMPDKYSKPNKSVYEPTGSYIIRIPHARGEFLEKDVEEPSIFVSGEEKTKESINVDLDNFLGE